MLGLVKSFLGIMRVLSRRCSKLRLVEDASIASLLVTALTPAGILLAAFFAFARGTWLTVARRRLLLRVLLLSRRNTACCLRANFLANAATTSTATATATVHFCCCATAVCLRPL
jgi:hypothetical protein